MFKPGMPGLEAHAGNHSFSGELGRSMKMRLYPILEQWNLMMQLIAHIPSNHHQQDPVRKCSFQFLPPLNCSYQAPTSLLMGASWALLALGPYPTIITLRMHSTALIVCNKSFCTLNYHKIHTSCFLPNAELLNTASKHAPQSSLSLNPNFTSNSKINHPGHLVH